MGETQFVVFLIFSFLTVAGLFVLGVFGFNLNAKGSRAYGVLSILLALWCFSIAGKMLSVSESTAFIWSIFLTIVSSFAPPSFFYFAGKYTGAIKKLSWWGFALLAIEPILAIIVYLTPALRVFYISEFIYEEVMGYLVMVEWVVGPLYIIHSSFAALFVLAGDVLIVRHALEWSHESRKKMFWLIGASTLPILTTATRLIPVFSHIRVNTDVVAFALATGIAGVVLYKDELLKIQPVSGRQLMDELPDPLLVFDLDGRYKESNPAAKAHFPSSLDPVVKKQFKEFLADPALNQGHHVQKKFNMVENGEHLHFDVHLSPLYQSSRMTGYQVFLRDVTVLTDTLIQLEELATTDPLTGLYNRRFFQDEGERLYEISLRYHHPICVMTFDIDHFKQINDSHGHPFGDEVLKKVAENMRSTCRKVDIIARFGGDEFVILIPESTAEEVAILAGRLQDRLKSEAFIVNDIATPLSISVGIVSCIPTAEKESLSLDEMMREADFQLYESKQAGRDRINYVSF